MTPSSFEAAIVPAHADNHPESGTRRIGEQRSVDPAGAERSDIDSKSGATVGIIHRIERQRSSNFYSDQYVGGIGFGLEQGSWAQAAAADPSEADDNADQRPERDPYPVTDRRCARKRRLLATSNQRVSKSLRI